MRFQYKALNSTGQEEYGAVEHTSEADALEILASRGLTVFDIETGDKPPAKPWYLRDIAFSSRHIGAVELSGFCNLLSSLLQAGLTLPDALNLMQRSLRHRKLLSLVERIIAKLEDGMDFSDAMDDEMAVLPEIFRAFIRIGVMSDDLIAVLEDAASYFSDLGMQKAAVQTSLLYPAILICSGIALSAVITFVLVPSLVPIFSASSSELPPVLSTLNKIREFLLAYGLFVVLTGAAFILISILFFSSSMGRSFLRRIFRQLPVIGPARDQSEIAQVLQALSMLLKSGLPLEVCCDILASVFGQRLSGPLLAASAEEIRSGGRLSEIWNAAVFVPPLARNAIQAGEATNSLSKLAAAAALQLMVQSDQTFTRAAQFATPLLTLVVGGGIGILVYTMMGAILEINEIAF